MIMNIHFLIKRWKISYAHMELLDTVCSWYCSSLVIFTYMVEYEDVHAQIRVLWYYVLHMSTAQMVNRLIEETHLAKHVHHF